MLLVSMCSMGLCCVYSHTTNIRNSVQADPNRMRIWKRRLDTEYIVQILKSILVQGIEYLVFKATLSRLLKRDDKPYRSIESQ